MPFPACFSLWLCDSVAELFSCCASGGSRPNCAALARSRIAPLFGGLVHTFAQQTQTEVCATTPRAARSGCATKSARGSPALHAIERDWFADAVALDAVSRKAFHFARGAWPQQASV